MGRRPKGLALTREGETLLARLVRVARASFDAPELVLVGQAEAYRAAGLEEIADAPAGVGPLGGLLALLRRAEEIDRPAIALACDLPRLTPTLVSRLVVPSNADAIAPRIDAIWQPLCAAYRPKPCIEAAETTLTAGRRALFDVLDALGPRAAVLDVPAELRHTLDDWDSPAEVARDGGSL
jgi:molybdopterin-guanine dinucleotide biosynthesis protein A